MDGLESGVIQAVFWCLAKAGLASRGGSGGSGPAKRVGCGVFICAILNPNRWDDLPREDDDPNGAM